MPAARDDFLLRLITQAAAALRRLRERLGGGTADEVMRDAGTAIGALLGPQRELLERLDATSARSIVGNPDTVRAWSALLVLQADAELLRGQPASSERLRARARALFPDVEQTAP
ncbi:MAG TPA: hypothetical protein VE869_02435 [Gemmatimonas sp.]|nr:hypothetical protein [Gemmatimonas sp.]